MTTGPFTELDVNNVTYDFPLNNATDWGTAVTNWATAVTNGMLQKKGGTFTLLDDVNFGPNFGLKSAYFASRNTLPATSGILRLNKDDSIAWRNVANDGNNVLSVDSSNVLLWNGDPITSGGGGNGAWLNIVAYGADPTGVDDSTNAIQDAIDACNDLKVGIYAPAGTYKVTSTLTKPTQVDSGYAHYFMGIKGDGPQGTTFDFSGLVSGNAIEIESVPQGSIYQEFAIEGPGIASGTHSGLHFPAATTDPGIDHTGVYDCQFKNIWVKQFSQNAFWWIVPYVCYMESLLAQDIGGIGFYVDYDHGPLGTVWVGGTSLQFTSCYANHCITEGYHFEPLVYSSLNSCAADDCTIGYGYYGCSAMTANGIGYELASSDMTGDCRAVYIQGPSGVTDVSVNLSFLGLSVNCATDTFNSFYVVELNEAQNCNFQSSHVYYDPSVAAQQPSYEILVQENGANNEIHNCNYYSDVTLEGGKWRINTNTFTENNNISTSTGELGGTIQGAYIIADTNAAGVTDPTDDSYVMEVKGNVFMYPVPGDISGKVGFNFFDETVNYVTLALHSTGEIAFGPGDADIDTSMYRSGVNLLTMPNIDTSLNIKGATQGILRLQTTGTVSSISIYNDTGDASLVIYDGTNSNTLGYFRHADGGSYSGQFIAPNGIRVDASIEVSGGSYVGGTTVVSTLSTGGSPAISAANVTLISGWDTSTIDSAGGSNSAGEIYIAVAGTPTANPVVRLTYTTAFPYSPTHSITPHSSVNNPGYWIVSAATSTYFEVTYIGTPATGYNVGFNYFGILV